MSFLPSFTTAAFAIAGLCCALGPVIIHLLNRRRFRVVQWAAMDFLREAIKRNRRIMQFRDLLLLLLRVAAVIFFGLALARPYYSASEEEYDASAPLHAVLIVDNSLSMGYQYEEFGETLLDRAKQVGKQFVDELPKGSRVSVVPLCGSGEAISPDPYRRKEDAVDALDKIEVVDRAGSIHLAASRASTACESAPRLAKRVVLLSDQQSENWRGAGSAKQFEAIPSMQIVDLFPTIAEVLQLHQPPGIQGTPWGRGRDYGLVENYTHWGRHPRYHQELVGVEAGGWKYIHSTRGREEVYDMTGDPQELENQVDRRIEFVERMRQIKKLRDEAIREQRQEMIEEDEGLREKLRSLGYL